MNPQDRRFEPRAAASARGVVIAQGLELTCIIADLSPAGMRIRMDRNLMLPDRVTLIDVAAGVAYEAEVAWRKGQEAGLKRGAQAALRGLVPSRLAAARQAWMRAGER